MPKESEMGGVPPKTQRAKLDESLAPWPKPGAVKDKATVVGEDPEYFLRIFEGTLVAIKSAENLGELQKQVVI
ncbi:MAG: hypothetical protein Q8Q10_03590, partial [bacterium]|nr:hypothetical protein [bacterium]